MTHRDLEVYKLSMALVRNIYKLTEAFPKQELFGLASQMQRAAVSIPSNIAEGASRNSTKEYIHFLSNATGSASELETQLGIVEMLGYCSDKANIDGLVRDTDQIRYMIVKMMNSLKKKLV